MHLTSLVRMSLQVALHSRPHFEFSDVLGRSVQRADSLVRQLTKLQKPSIQFILERSVNMFDRVHR
jgi:hypothetical protein